MAAPDKLLLAAHLGSPPSQTNVTDLTRSSSGDRLTPRAGADPARPAGTEDQLTAGPAEPASADRLADPQPGPVGTV